MPTLVKHQDLHANLSQDKFFLIRTAVVILDFKVCIVSLSGFRGSAREGCKMRVWRCVKSIAAKKKKMLHRLLGFGFHRARL